jgi:magnesium transporter
MSVIKNPNDPIYRHMHPNLTRLRSQQTVGEALDWLRENPPPGRIIYFYVVDDQERLLGVVPARRLLLAPPQTPIVQLMVEQVVTLPIQATVLEACEFFIQHRFLALPVVDEDRRLVGVVDVDLYTDEREYFNEETRRDDLFQLIGVQLAAARTKSSWLAIRSRFPWLLCNISGGLAAAWLTGLFETELQAAVALALFIPVVLALSESVSMQSVSLVLERLHGGRPNLSRLIGELRQELLTGLGLGLLCSLCVSLVALVWLGQGRVAACLLGGIWAGVSLSAAIGMLIPASLRLFTHEPRVAAGPIALAMSDLATLLVYFGLARWLLS